jgi:hypothetical protein
MMGISRNTLAMASPYLEVFQHDTCRLLYQTDVFWVTETIAREHLDAMLNVFSRDREGVHQTIIEVIL